MTPNVADKGRSFKGAVAYITHDPDQAETDERVLFVETRNLRTNDPAKAAKVMAYTAMHAAQLKADAGLKATGRKTDSPVYHLSLSWVPGETPSQAAMMEAGEAAMKLLGFAGHEAVYAAHGDKAHMHLHVVVNRINPETGKTHNPQNDQLILHGWGHEYDKARGLEHHSPERAARYEKDPAQKAEYQKRAEALREKQGAANDNTKSRPSWKAAKDATHPKSRRYQEITDEYRGRAKALAAESRDLADRQKKARDTLGSRQRDQKAELSKALRLPSETRATFEAASGPARLSHPQLRAEWKNLKAAQRKELRSLQDTLKAGRASLVRGFMAGQRAEAAAARKEEKQSGLRITRNLEIVVNTPIRAQGQAHRGHLAAGFRNQAEGPLRSAQAAEKLKREKDKFFDGLAKDDAPQLAALKDKQSQEGQALRGRLRTARKPTARQARTIRQQRAELATTQKAERAELRAVQLGERAELQGKWAAMNDDRTKAWDGYRAHRSAQAGSKDAEKSRQSDHLKDVFSERNGLYESRRTVGRDYVENSAGNSRDAGHGGRKIKPN